MAKEATKPLEITAHLLDGRLVSTDGILMFDGILYHAWFCKNASHVLRGECNDAYGGNIGLPLRQLPGNRWTASKAVYTEISRHVEYYNKRPDFFSVDKQRYLNQQRGIIDESAGKFRAYRNPVIVRTVKDAEIKFYAMGHADEVTAYLNSMFGVGKKTSMGWGIVTDWNVKEIDIDYSLYHPKYGLMRPVLVDEPCDMDLSEYPIMNYAVKPPYWKQKNFRTCYVPIAR